MSSLPGGTGPLSHEVGDWGPNGGFPSLAEWQDGPGLLLTVQPLPQSIFCGDRRQEHVGPPFQSPHLTPAVRPSQATQLSRPTRAQASQPPGHVHPGGAI